MKFRLKNAMYLLLFLSVIFKVNAQERTVSGVVSDDVGPLPGVNIIIKNTSKGTESDADGKYSIKAKTGDILVFSFVGMKTVERPVGASNKIDVTLENDNFLEEIVVVAYGAQSEKKVITSVSKVNQEAIKDLVTDSPQNILQGQASGVQVVSSSGVLGASPELRIRGTNSIGTNVRPLFVVDGVILGDDFLTGAQGGGQGLNPLSSINPNDIENISVLKSAAATALYGSRGANGVVIITTKTGSKDGSVKVNLDFSTSISSVTDTPELLNAQQFRDFSAITAPTRTIFDGNFDFIDAVFRNAVSQSYNLGVNGGNEKSSFYIGVTREDQEGILVGNELERTSFRGNIKTQANDWLTLGLNSSVSVNKFDRTPQENAFAAPYTIANLQRQDVNPIDENGNFTTAGNVGGGNVIAQELLNLNLATETRITGNAFADIDFSSLLNGLSFKTDFGVDRRFVEAQTREVDLLTPGGEAFNGISQQNRFTITPTFLYNNKLGEKHNLSLLAGYSYDQNDIRNIDVAGTGFLDDSFINVTSASTFTTTSSDGTTSRLVSYFGRASYDYDNGKYVLEASLRRDGSSRFGLNNQFGTFWSAAFGWNISDENFMADVNWIRDLILNVSAGTAGNDRIGNFASLGTFFNSPYNNNPGLRPNSLANPDLRWETTTGFDAGISASFLNRRLTVGVEFYKKITDDLILNVPVDPTFNLGLNAVATNIGEIQNTGVDVDITSVNFDTESGFKWTTNLNIGYNKNEVTKLPGDNIDERGNRFVAQGGSFSGQRAIEGHSANSFYLIRYVGVNPQTGDAEWLDADGNITTNPTQADRVVAGQANPDFVGGLTNTFKYKNWSLSTLFNFSVGNDIFLASRSFSENPRSGFNKTTRVLNIWQNPGDNAFIPSTSSSTYGVFEQDSTLQLEDGSFARLKNVTLAYSLPQSLLDNVFLSNVRFYATATNLLTIKSDGLDGYDPETSRNADGGGAIGEEFFNIPQARTYTLGVNITF